MSETEASSYHSGVGRPPLRHPFIRDRVGAYAREAGVPMNDVFIRAIELYTRRPRRVIPWPRATVFEEKVKSRAADGTSRAGEGR